MKKKIIIRIIFIMLIILWAIFVFGLSSQGGSESGGLSLKITSFFIHEENKIKIVEPYIRKIAHLSEYTLGGMLFMGFFYTYDWNDIMKIIISSLFGIFYAVTDEIHQLFIPDRNGNIIDIIIDSIGVILGSFILLFFIHIICINVKSKEESVNIER